MKRLVSAIIIIFVLNACNNEAKQTDSVGDSLTQDPLTGQPITTEPDTIGSKADTTINKN
jgi:PBP1b-binding outer membrane lipoprotein LpoB